MQTVISAFEDRESAQRALERLVQAGIPQHDVHLEPGLDRGAASSPSGAADHDGGRAHEEHQGVLASMGAFFASLFESSTGHDHSTYSEAVRRGSTVLIVDASDEAQADRAADILRECGALNIDERAQQWRQEGWTGAVAAGAARPRMAAERPAADMGRREPQADLDPRQPSRDLEPEPHQPALDIEAPSPVGNLGARPRGLQAESDGRTTMDVVEEDVHVGKRSIDRGGIRVIQRVSERPVRELVKLREEKAVVDRRPVDRTATAADLETFRDGQIEIRETVEEPVVAKTARVVEEVVVSKEVQERSETINETVRRKDVDVERLEGQGSASRSQVEHAAAGASLERPLASEKQPTTQRTGAPRKDQG